MDWHQRTEAYLRVSTAKGNKTLVKLMKSPCRLGQHWGKGDSVEEIAEYWSGIDTEEIHRRVARWKSEVVSKT